MADWTLPETCVFEGRPVRYEGIGDGPALVIVHGTHWSSFNMRHLVKALAKDFRIYYFDLIGYGQSDKTNADVSLGIQNKVLDNLLEHWGLDSPLIIGHDFWGTTVLRTHLLIERILKKLYS
jgi:pimeloyl-ACP methyl ester carboxylesterase